MLLLLCAQGLHWRLVAGVCDLLHLSPQLRRLHLSRWSCRRLGGLLSDHGRDPGWQLAFLPALTHVSVSGVGEDFFRRLGRHCPGLVELRAADSDVTDGAVSWLSCCRNLEMAELFDNRGVSPSGKVTGWHSKT